MKILHLCLANFYIDNYSYQENLLPIYHQKLGNEVKIIASWINFNKNGDLFVDNTFNNQCQYFTREGIEVFRIPYLKSSIGLFNKLFVKLRLYSKWSEKVHDFNPDVLFIHGGQFLDIYKINDFKRRNPNLKIYVDNHADYINSGKNWLSLNLLHKIIWKYAIKNVEKIINKFWGVTPLRSKFLKEVYSVNPMKVDTLIMGVDEDASEFDKKDIIRKEIRNYLKISDDSIVFIHGGKIDELKNTIQLIQGFSKNLDKNWKLLLFGTVSDSISNKFYELIEQDKRIIYLGWKDSKDIYKYIYSSDISIYPGTHSVLWEQSIGLGQPTIIKKWEGFDHLNINDSVILLENIKDLNLLMNQVANNLSYYNNIAKENIKIFSYKGIAKKSIEII